MHFGGASSSFYYWWLSAKLKHSSSSFCVVYCNCSSNWFPQLSPGDLVSSVISWAISFSSNICGNLFLQLYLWQNGSSSCNTNNCYVGCFSGEVALSFPSDICISNKYELPYILKLHWNGERMANHFRVLPKAPIGAFELSRPFRCVVILAEKWVLSMSAELFNFAESYAALTRQPINLAIGALLPVQLCLQGSAQ